MSKCDIIVPVWNELESTKKCVENVKDNTSYPYTLIAIDNGSDKPTEKYLKELKNSFSNFKLIRNEKNLGFVKAINQGMQVSNSDYVCLLNNDAYVTKDWLKNLIQTVESGPSNIGIANPTSNVFGAKGPDGEKFSYQEIDSAKGFSMLIKKEVLKKIGFFDEIYGIGYFEEKDFSKRAIQAGYICIRAKSSFVFHKDKLTFDKLKDRDKIFKENETIYNKKWGRSLSIAFILDKISSFENWKELINVFLGKGYSLHIFFPSQYKKPYIRDHIQVRYRPTSKLFFNCNVLFRLWERRNKKKIDIILTSKKNAINFFSKLGFVHGADVMDDVNKRIVEFCETKSKRIKD